MWSISIQIVLKSIHHLKSLKSLSLKIYIALNILMKFVAKQVETFIYSSVSAIFALEKAYTQFIEYFHYGLPLFTNITKSSLNQTKRVNKKCHTIICSDDPCCCDTLDIQLMQKKQILRLIKKLTIINTPLSSLFPNKSKTGRYILPRAKTTRKVKSFIFKACQVFNANFSRS